MNSKKVDRDFVRHVGGTVLAARLATMPDPTAIEDAHLAILADLSVRASIELDAAIERAEERLAEEAKAAKDAEAAVEAEAKAAEHAAAEEAKLAKAAALIHTRPDPRRLEFLRIPADTGMKRQR
jgi:hypothetical protein